MANVNLNLANSYCQSSYYYLPIDWIFAPDNVDSLYAIYYNTWSTTTVVVASGVGYYSKSTFGLRNTAYSNWLIPYYSPSYGYSWKCAKCNCEILIMYSPYPKTLKPSYSPIMFSDPSPSYTSSTSSSSSSSGNSGLYSLVVLPFFLVFFCFTCIYKYRRRVQAMQIQQVQVQPSIPGVINSAGYYEQPTIDNNNYPVVVQAQYGNSSYMQQPHPQQQPYGQIQPGYIQLPLQQVNQPLVHGYAQPQPQVYGYEQPQMQYGYAQPQLQAQQPQSHVYSYGNSELQPQPQPQVRR